MKSILASAIAVAVLTSGAPVKNGGDAQLPPWVCELFPMFCTRR